MSALHMSVLLVIALLISCRTPRNLPSTHTSDRVNFSYNLDSVYHYEKDSMAISFRPAVFLAAASPLGDRGVRKDSLEQTSGGAQSAGDICGMTTFRTDDLTAAVFPRDTLVIERWHTRFKDHEVVKTDTVYITSPSRGGREGSVPRFYQWCTALFWIICVGICVYIGLRIIKVLYLR